MIDIEGLATETSWGDGRAQAESAADAIRSQAAQAAGSARGALNAMVGDARDHLNDDVSQQKDAGAAQLAGLAKAAQNAAGELDAQNPTVARAVRDAAETVDRMAENLRSSDVRQLLQTMTTLARTYPVAVFAGSLLTGFALARFLKADAVPSSHSIAVAGSLPDATDAAAVDAQRTVPVHRPPVFTNGRPPL